MAKTLVRKVKKQAQEIQRLGNKLKEQKSEVSKYQLYLKHAERAVSNLRAECDDLMELFEDRVADAMRR